MVHLLMVHELLGYVASPSGMRSSPALICGAGEQCQDGADVVQNDVDDQDAGEQEDGGTWVTVRDAATLLNVSVDTVKRRMQRGALPRRRETIPQGFRWLVRIDPPQNEVPESPQDNERPSQGLEIPAASPDVVGALLNELRVRNQEIALLHETIAALTRAVEQRLLAITAGETPPETAPEAPGSSPANDRGTSGIRAWVRRFWRS